MFKLKLISLVLLGVVFCCTSSFAADRVSVCCSGKKITKQQCCENNGGMWCEADQACFKLGTDALFESSCMTETACNSVYGYWCGDESSRCFLDYREHLVSGCPTVTRDYCNSFGNKFRWCDEPGKGGCYYYNIVRDPKYSTYCTSD